ncbi:hypothetical protein GBAR_LOCUS27840 [Geodia barretti]|uniref:Uncharacterized protein n=1 Tax=Geodia barretti TaxID=519541 RepID=A0AA35XAY5_GEOBA|nr:hypothetical protein GBAR_LOCUS27840 [Geodia barretti]
MNNAIYRTLLEETSSDSGVFEGTIEYKMLNQLSVDDAGTYDDVVAVDDELVIILDDGYTGTSAPEVAYDGDHVREDAPTYTGEVSFDSATYRVADEVTVTWWTPTLTLTPAQSTYTPLTPRAQTDADTLLHLEISDGCTIDDFENFSLRETADDSDTFEGSFEVPSRSATAQRQAKTSRPPTMTSGTHPAERPNGATLPRSVQTPALSALTGPSTRYRQQTLTVMVYVSVDDGDFDESSTSVESIAVTEGDAPVTVKVITTDEDYNLEQGSIITVTYNDPTDASGNENSVSDSATFDLRNAVLQSDKSTYVIGQDALLTLIEPDLNLDSDSQETLPLDIIAWDSDAEGKADLSFGEFGAVPSNLRETDVNTGIFQVVITIPEEINGNALERGEEITLTYTD